MKLNLNLYPAEISILNELITKLDIETLKTLNPSEENHNNYYRLLTVFDKIHDAIKPPEIDHNSVNTTFLINCNVSITDYESKLFRDFIYILDGYMINKLGMTNHNLTFHVINRLKGVINS